MRLIIVHLVDMTLILCHFNELLTAIVKFDLRLKNQNTDYKLIKDPIFFYICTEFAFCAHENN
jgi:hypothetical protein